MLFETIGSDLDAVAGETAEAPCRPAAALDYQPIMSLGSGGLVGLEAIMRRKPPEPSRMVDTRLLTQACVEARYWPGCRLAVNVSPGGLGGLLDQVETALAASGLAPALLDIELSERSRFASMPGVLRALRARGVGLVLDDFGAGNVSLRLLRRLPWTAVKLDRSLVAEPGKTAHGLLAAAQALGLRLMADGLETLWQRDLLIRLGCHEAQGPLYGRPTNPDRLAALLDYRVDTCSGPRSGSETSDDRAVPH